MSDSHFVLNILKGILKYCKRIMATLQRIEIGRLWISRKFLEERLCRGFY